MSLSSLAEKFRSQFPAIDQHYREQEQVQAEAQLAQAALLAQQESALVQASVDRWQATHQPDNAPCVYDVEVALKIAAEQGLTWSQVVLNGLRLQEAGKRMTAETERLNRWLFPPKAFQAGVASYSRPPRPSRQIKYMPNM